MKRVLIIITGIIILTISCSSPGKEGSLNNRAENDSLPSILPEGHADLVAARARLEASVQFSLLQLPGNLKDWEVFKSELRRRIIQKTGAVVNQALPLDLKESGSLKMKGYTIKNIYFQTRQGIYATANLYIPDGKGPFPAVIVMSGHSINGRMGSQTLGYTLALNGYVSMTIDPWGAGERTTNHSSFEYHGANLGASLMNIGESLMGIQITDNMRGVDLLTSLPYVDPLRIGATGASGGGNQTMWLTAMDDRIKASVPVVSVGTFESYVMGHNCICEVLIDGLTFTEESGILALVAPRALMLSNGLKDSNSAFNPSEMLRSYANAMPVYEMYGAEKKFTHLIFDGPHSYPPETREAMIDLFNVNLKAIPPGARKKSAAATDRQPQEKLMVFTPGQRDPKVMSTAEFCRERGKELRMNYLDGKSVDVDQKKKELNEILKIGDEPVLKAVNKYSSVKGWDRISLETSDGKLIPVLLKAPSRKSLGYMVVCNSDGANNISLSQLDDLKKKGFGIVIIELSGTGEATSFLSKSNDQLAKLHTYARAELWLGKRVLGEWVKELSIVDQFLRSDYKAGKISIDGTKEAGLAALFFGALNGDIDKIILRDAPVSYMFDVRESIDFYSLGIHLPGFLKWGDVSLAAAICGKNVTFINPLTMSGNVLSSDKLKELQSEYENVSKLCGEKGKTSFN